MKRSLFASFVLAASAVVESFMAACAPVVQAVQAFVASVVATFTRDEGYVFEGPQTAGGTNQGSAYRMYRVVRDNRLSAHMRLCA